ncbi:MAG: EamA family transporter RarD [Rhodobacteraceae bacterium]|nr:EamA family transporter RarD [Paracoccaceae bacterium]
MNERTKGRLAMIAAGAIWGLSPMYYKVIAHVPPGEVLAHRAIFSFATFFAVLLVQGRARQMFRSVFSSLRKFGFTLLTATLIGSNWLLFIFAIQIERATQASLGYFLYPLIAVFLGSVFLKERLTPPQWMAVATTAIAVLYLSVVLGEFPFLATVLASTFAIYGLIKKKTRQGAVASVAAESFVLTPVALLWLLGVHLLFWQDFTGRAGGWFGNGLLETAMLAASGLITAGPLVLMSYGLKRIRYSEGGFLLYTNPTLQFLVAVLIFMEPFTAADLAAFVLIWIALLVFSLEAPITSGLRAIRR